MRRATSFAALGILACALAASATVFAQKHSASNDAPGSLQTRAYAPSLSADSLTPGAGTPATAIATSTPTATPSSTPNAAPSPPATATLTIVVPTAEPSVVPSPSPTPVPSLPTANVTLHDGASPAVLRVELATTPAQQERGLMFRMELPDSQGMLFVFPRDSSGAFWMKNTYIPLDIAWIDASGIVLGVSHGVPLDLTGLPPPSPYRYVLEVAGGWFERHGMSAGAMLDLPPDLTSP
jgi:uncharacterized protein